MKKKNDVLKTVTTGTTALISTKSLLNYFFSHKTCIIIKSILNDIKKIELCIDKIIDGGKERKGQIVYD